MPVKKFEIIRPQAPPKQEKLNKPTENFNEKRDNKNKKVDKPELDMSIKN